MSYTFTIHSPLDMIDTYEDLLGSMEHHTKLLLGQILSNSGKERQKILTPKEYDQCSFQYIHK